MNKATALATKLNKVAIKGIRDLHKLNDDDLSIVEAAARMLIDQVKVVDAAKAFYDVQCKIYSGRLSLSEYTHASEGLDNAVKDYYAKYPEEPTR